jgi:hypothetical protein
MTIMPGELLLINPRKRKTKTKRAAPRRARAKSRTSARRKAPVIVMANPSPRRRRSRLGALRTKAKRVGRRYKRNPISKLSFSNISSMAKHAALGASGALAVDLAFGYVKPYLPASMQSPIDAAGGMNPMYFLAKGGVAVVAGVLGQKVTKHAGDMAAGSLTVSAYEMLRTFVPASMQLGAYMNPAAMAGRRNAPPQLRQGMQRFVSGQTPGMGRYDAPVNTLYQG